MRWSDVARQLGKVAHREMQWHALTDGSGDPVRDPATGEMDREELDALCELLAPYTADINNCFFGLCDILGWVNKLFPPERRMQRPLKLPMERNYVVLRGSLGAVREIGDERLGGMPSLIWPADHSWFVVSEVDFDSTLVGGASEVIRAIVGSPRLEAWRVEPTDSLAADADRINVT